MEGHLPFPGKKEERKAKIAWPTHRKKKGWMAGEGKRKKAKEKAAMTPSIFVAVVQMIIIIDHAAASNARIPLRSKTNDAPALGHGRRGGRRRAREHAQGAIHK